MLLSAHIRSLSKSRVHPRNHASRPKNTRTCKRLNVRFITTTSNTETITTNPDIRPNSIVSTYFKEKIEIPQATFLNSRTNPTRWMMFEKYDGIRAVWDSQKRVFFSRFGKILRIPQRIIMQIPKELPSLDGEIWFGRQLAKETYKITNKSDPRSVAWSQFRFMVFDIPSTAPDTYEDRYEKLKHVVPPEHEFIRVAPAIICKGLEHLNQYAQSIISSGGEGVILRNPKSTNIKGPSKDYIKFKIFKDEEGRVVSILGMNTFLVELADGTQFEASCAKEIMNSAREIKPGDVISFKYTRFQDSKPVSPIIYLFRDDMQWEDVLNKHIATRQPKILRQNPNQMVVRRRSVTPVPAGYWSENANCRAFFIKFAQIKGFQPTDLEKWYDITVRDVAQHGGNGILDRYKRSLKNALIDTFPEYKWDVNQFRKMGYWTITENCRIFFESFAKQSHFDPLDVNNWYPITIKSLVEYSNNTYGLLRAQTLPEALQKSFPELKWDLTKFDRSKKAKEVDNEFVFLRTTKAIPEVDAQTKTSLKSFLDGFAFKKGFEPENKAAWKNVTYKDIILEEGGRRLLRKVGGSIQNALQIAYS